MKRLLAVVGLAAVACLLATCRESPTTRGSAPSAPRLTLRVLAEDSAQLAAFAAITAQYTATSHLGVEIVRSDHRRLLDLIREPQPSSPGYDLVIVPHGLVGSLVEHGDVRPLDDLLDDATLYDPRLVNPQSDLFAGWAALSHHHGRIYGYPFTMRAASLWFREDLFDDEDEATAFERRYGRPLTIPRTPSELEQTTEFFHRPEQGLYGTVIHGRPDESLVAEWLRYAAMFDARILASPSSDTYGDVVVNAPEAVRATEFIVRLLAFSPPEAMQYGEADAARGFERRRFAVGLMRHDFALAAVRSAGVPPGGVAYAPIPSEVGRAVMPLDGEMFLIPQRTDRARDAFALMQWALSHEAQVAQILNGGLSVRPSSFADPRVTALPKAHQNRPYMPIWIFPTLAATTWSPSVPSVSEFNQITDAMSSGLSRVLAGGLTPRAGLDDIAIRLAEILKGKAKLRYPPRKSRPD